MTVARGEDVLTSRASDIQPANSILACDSRAVYRGGHFLDHWIGRKRRNIYESIRSHICSTPSSVGGSERLWLRSGQPAILGQMDHVVCGGSRIAAVRYFIGRAPHLWMALLIFPNLLRAQPGLLQHFVELILRPPFGLGEDHLAARQGMNLRVALDFNRGVQQIRIFADHV